VKKPARWHQCNVVARAGENTRLWQFAREGEEARLRAERTVEPAEAATARLGVKTVSDLWQPRLNVAWLPADQVFLRVISLPVGDPSELPGMVELQIEKLSPLPLAQVVWTFEPLPARDGQAQTIIVLLATRSAVESFLGELEGMGYLADRLDLPQLHELLATPDAGDGVWIYPRTENGQLICLAAWRHEGRLQNLDLLRLPDGPEAGAQLAALLKQSAWAGEMNGWFTPEARWHLVADAATAVGLEPSLRTLAGGGLELAEPLPLPRLAALAAASATRVNLVPPEFLVRYRQQFVDRLWMRALGGLVLVYLVFLLGCFAYLQVRGYQKDNLDRQVAELHSGYTNALQLKARVQVLQDQVSLKFAALDCWRAVAEALPPELTLTGFTFQRGKKLQLFGSVAADLQSKVTEFNEALSKATANGQPLFSQVSTKSIQAPPVGQNRPALWSLECDLKRTDF
jgi:hypothetical protein